MNLNGKTALITGGARRIGRALCKALAAEGCRIFIHYRRSCAEARALAKQLRRQGVQAMTVGGELRDQNGCANIMSQILAETPQLDILINNAAVFHKRSCFTGTEEDWRRDWEINFLAPWRLMAAFAAQGGQRILNLLDCRIVSCNPASASYSLSKKSLAELTRMAARELAPRITVNALAPGPILPTAGSASREKAGRLPLQKRPSMNDLTAAALFLLRAESITGQIVFVDSGQHLLG